MLYRVVSCSVLDDEPESLSRVVADAKAVQALGADPTLGTVCTMLELAKDALRRDPRELLGQALARLPPAAATAATAAPARKSSILGMMRTFSARRLSRKPSQKAMDPADAALARKPSLMSLAPAIVEEEEEPAAAAGGFSLLRRLSRRPSLLRQVCRRWPSLL